MQKTSTIVLYVLSAVSIVLALLFFFGPTTMEGAEEVPKFYTHNLAWAGILFVAAVALTLLFSIGYIITHPKALKGAAIALLGLGVLVLISYVLASDAPIKGVKVVVSPSGLRWIGTALYATYILGAVAIISIVVSEIYGAVK